MTEDLGDMADMPCLLGCTQRQIVVLASFETLSHAARRQEQTAPHDEQAAHVHVRQQQRGRPIGLELRFEPASRRVDLVVVAIDDVRLGVVGGVDSDLSERFGAEDIAGIEEGQEFTGGAGSCRVGRIACPVVRDAQFPILVDLRPDASHRRIERVRACLMGNQDYRYARQSSPAEPRAPLATARGLAHCIRAMPNIGAAASKAPKSLALVRYQMMRVRFLKAERMRFRFWRNPRSSSRSFRRTRSISLMTRAWLSQNCA